MMEWKTGTSAVLDTDDTPSDGKLNEEVMAARAGQQGGSTLAVVIQPPSPSLCRGCLSTFHNP